MERWTKFQPAHSDLSASLFAWRGGEIVLFGEHADDGSWTLARGWRGPGTLTDVRRWTFSTPERFVAQVRRLAAEAVGDGNAATEAAAAAMAWATAIANR